MIKGNITFLDNSPALAVTIGLGEDVKAPRDLAAMEKQGWVIDDNLTATYKAWLAGKRQGNIPTTSRFEEWVDNVAEVDLRPARKDIEAAVAMGTMEREQADKLIAFMETNTAPELVAPPAE